MSAIVYPSSSHRPVTLTVAAALLALVVALTLVIVLTGFGGFDPVFLAIAGTLAALKLVAAAGLWGRRRWAAILGSVATLLDTLLALGGFFDGSIGAGVLAATTAAIVALGVITLVLLALPASRRAYM